MARVTTAHAAHAQAAAVRRLAGVAIGVAVLDFATKLIVAARLAVGETVEIVPGLFQLTHTQNQGAAFSILSGSDFAYKPALFTIITLVAIAGIIIYAARVPADNRWLRVALGLILGGAAGNLVDRVRTGYVTDFFDLHWKMYHWPVFNLADSAITIGVGLLLLDTLRGHKPSRQSSVVTR